MSVALYLDVHVHSGIARGLRERGAEVLTAQEDGAAQLDDDALLDRVGARQRVLFTNDRDFLAIVTTRQRNNQPFAGVIYGPQTAPLGLIVHDLTLCALACDREDFDNALTYLPFR